MHEGQRVASEKLAVDFDERRIDAIFAAVDTSHLPGAAVGIAIEARPVYRKGFGLAHMELPLVLKPTIRMRIASISKHFTALAYMLLCEDDKAGIDDPVGKHLPELHPVTHQVTMRQLMGNISGLRDPFDLCLEFSDYGRRVSTEQLVDLYRDIADTNFPPSTSWAYNNGGFEILSVAIERIARRSLEDVLRETVFEPVGMYQTLLRRTDDNFVPNSATPHQLGATGRFEKREASNLFVMSVAGEGGIVSTVDDMLLWLAHMDRPVVGSTATWEAMGTPQELLHGTSTGYGLGLVVGRYRGVRTLHHSGGGTGSNAFMLKVPAAGLDIICMVNRSDLSSAVFVEQILESCLPGLDPVTKGPHRLLATGTYHSPTTGRVIQFRDTTNAYFLQHPQLGERQYIVSIDGTDEVFELAEDGALRPVGIAAFGPQEIRSFGDGAIPTSLTFIDYGNVDELMAVGSTQTADISQIVGRYRSDPTGIELEITADGDRPWVHSHGPFGSTMKPAEFLGAHIFKVTSVNVGHRSGILSFDPDGAGLRYSTWCTRSLSFRRTS